MLYKSYTIVFVASSLSITEHSWHEAVYQLLDIVDMASVK